MEILGSILQAQSQQIDREGLQKERPRIVSAAASPAVGPCRLPLPREISRPGMKCLSASACMMKTEKAQSRTRIWFLEERPFVGI
jgi:hypothetical protein